jgi:hypothetical protein
MTRILLYIAYHDEYAYNEALRVRENLKPIASCELVKVPRTFFFENILWYILQMVDTSKWDYIGILPYKYIQKSWSQGLPKINYNFTGDCLAFLSCLIEPHFYAAAHTSHDDVFFEIWDALLERVVPGADKRLPIAIPTVYCSAFALKSTIFKEWIDFIMKCLDHIDVLNNPIRYGGSITRDQLISMGCKDGQYAALTFISERLISWWLQYMNYSVQVVSVLRI